MQRGKNSQDKMKEKKKQKNKWEDLYDQITTFIIRLQQLNNFL